MREEQIATRVCSNAMITTVRQSCAAREHREIAIELEIVMRGNFMFITRVLETAYQQQAIACKSSTHSVVEHKMRT